MISNFSVDKDKCVSCGKCINVCTQHVFYADNKSVEPNNPSCLKCYHCYAVCPREAISIKGIDHYPETGSINTGKIDDLINLFSMRRSYRKFQKKNIEDSLIRKIVDSGIYTPSGGNDRSYNFTVIKSGEIKKSLKNELVNIYKIRSMILNNFFLRIFLKPFLTKFQKEFLKNKEYQVRIKNLINDAVSGKDPFFYDAPAIIVVHSDMIIPTPKEDSILAAYNINLSAEIYGLGGCFVTLAQDGINSSVKCKNILNLNKHEYIYAVLIMGYPENKYLRVSPRMKKNIRTV